MWPGKRRHQEGLALPVVLWLVLLLGLLFSGYSYHVRSDTVMARQWLDSARGRAAAEAGFQQMVYQLLRQGKEPLADSQELVVNSEYNGVGLRIGVINHSGLVDLNRASDALLDALLVGMSLSDEERMTILDSIRDWRDGDSERRDFGAEDDDYAALGLPYGAADAVFTSVDELALVKGMTPDLFDRLRGMVTVFSTESGINPELAPENLLLSLAGDSAANALGDWRSDHSDSALQYFANLSKRDLTSRIGNVYGIEVEASTANGVKTRLSAVIRLAGGPSAPFTLLEWKEVEKLVLIQ